MQNIYKNIENAVDFLYNKQREDGSFLSKTTNNPKKFSEAHTCHTVFSTALILLSLCDLKESSKIKAIKKKIFNFLLSQKNESWTFNYWAKQAPEYKTMPYPDDLDDTSCALTALCKHNPKLIDGKILGNFVMMLIALEENEGGPYRTWFVKPDADKIWQDVDLAVNANIAYFLFLQNVDLPNLSNFIEKSIFNEKLNSPYYCSNYSIPYFISRFYDGKNKDKLINFILKNKNIHNYWNNPLDTSLAILTLLNLGIEPETLNSSIEYIINKQTNGSWSAYAFYTGINPKRDKKKYYAGSDALTTAFCIEALNKHILLSKNNLPQKKEKNTDQKEKDNIYNNIITNINKDTDALDKDLKKQSNKIITEILSKNKEKEIALLPYYFKKSLGDNAKNISDGQLIQLGLINIYGWTAYDIFDDFLDEEGKPKYLPTAIYLLRKLTSIFNNILPEESKTIFDPIMNKIDTANAWEVSNCRTKIKNNKIFIPKKLPNYKNFIKLAERSIGHALGPIAILALLDYNINSHETKNLILFFEHYIIARQLNDDAHDWEDDLKAGHINSAGTLLLEKYKGKSKTNTVELKNIVPDLQRIFWYDVIPNFCNEIKKQLKLAEQSLLKISIIRKPNILLNFLKPIKQSVEKTLSEREETIKFLKVFK